LEEFAKDPMAFTRNMMDKVEDYAIDRMTTKVISLVPQFPLSIKSMIDIIVV
jgi:hypothetical protein